MIVVLKRRRSASASRSRRRASTSRRSRPGRTSSSRAQQAPPRTLALQGVVVQPELRFTRVLDGFSAVARPERRPAARARPGRRRRLSGARRVSGRRCDLATRHAAASGRRAIALPGFDGRGVAVALLDTGVDRPAVSPRPTSCPGSTSSARDDAAAQRTRDPRQLERHGTEMAGHRRRPGGPGGRRARRDGAADPRRRLAARRRPAVVYARTDQLIAGLERAVDPNGDGDAHDAARIALVALAEPFAALRRRPARARGGRARCARHARRRAGRERRPRRPGVRDIAGPGGAPAALTVGAATRARSADGARRRARGLASLFDATCRCSAPRAPTRARRVALADAAHAHARAHDFFDARGLSLVAGRAALVARGATPARRPRAQRGRRGGGPRSTARARSRRRRSALDERRVPVVVVPGGAPRVALHASPRGDGVDSRSRRRPRRRRTPSAATSRRSRRAGSPSTARVKPDLVAPGVGVATAEPGATPTARRASSPSAARAPRPRSSRALRRCSRRRGRARRGRARGLLVGTARPLARDPRRRAGRRARRPRRGRGRRGRRVARDARARAVDRCRLAGAAAVHPHEPLDAHGCALSLAVRRSTKARQPSTSRVQPAAHRARAGRERARPRRRAHGVARRPAPATADGAVVAAVAGGGSVRVPWALAFGRTRRPARARVALARRRSRRPTDAGAAHRPRRPRDRRRRGGRSPAARSARRRALARRRAAPRPARAAPRRAARARYTFGLTGRGAGGQLLAARPLRRCASSRFRPTAGAAEPARRSRFTPPMSSHILAARIDGQERP